MLLHAGICDSGMWEPQWQRFPAEHRTVRCDLRGFGESPVPPGSYSHGADVVDLIEELGLEDCALVGASMGGLVALEVAIARPDLISSLILVCAALDDHDWSEPVERYDEAEGAALTRGELDVAIEANLRFWVDGPSRRADEVDSEVRARVATMQRRAFELQAEADPGADESSLVGDVGRRCAEIGVPTLVVIGELDIPDMHEIADRLATTVPRAERLTIGGAAHLPSLERPALFDDAALSFLAA
jgi:3-oxoadipate enol-lactonase